MSRPALRRSLLPLAVSIVAAVVLVDLAAGTEDAASSTPEPAAGDGELLYAVGVALGRNLNGLDLTAEELDAVEQGLRDAALRRELQVDPASVGPRMQGFLNRRMEQAVDRQRTEGAAFRETMAAEAGAETLDSGVIVRTIEPGDGPSPDPGDRVLVHYVGTLPDGTVFDSSRGEPAEPREFALDEVIACFSEGIGRMRVGESAVLVCPPERAYGDRGFPPMILPATTLRFDVELLGIVGSIEDDSGEAPDAPAPETDGGAD